MDPVKQLAEDNLIYKVRCGSHAYGTNLASSDVDYAGIFIPPIDYYLGLRAFDLLSEQTEDDKSYYSLRKFANLAVANNPNVLELLFVDPGDILLYTEASERLRESRHLFLSQRCQKTFVGYAKAQLHRIRMHTKWLIQEEEDMKILLPLAEQGRLTKEWIAWRFGENMVQRMESCIPYQHFYIWESGKISNRNDSDALAKLFKSSNIICPEKGDERFFVMKEIHNALNSPVLVFQKHLYDEAKKKRDQYVTWMAERNPARHDTEIKFGYDTKHAMHLVRLLRMGYEILTTGDLTVRRPDAQELLDIRAGKWTYEEVTNYADEMVDKIESLTTQQVAVPNTPDTETINNIIISITQTRLGMGCIST